MAMHNHITPPSPSVVNLEVYVCRKGHCLYPCFERFYSNTAILTAFPYTNQTHSYSYFRLGKVRTHIHDDLFLGRGYTNPAKAVIWMAPFLFCMEFSITVRSSSFFGLGRLSFFIRSS